MLVLVIAFLYSKHSENFATNTEAIQAISSLYNAGTLTATNINATNRIHALDSFDQNHVTAGDSRVGNDLYVTKNLTVSGNISSPNINSPNGTVSGAKVYGTQIHSGNDILADGRVTGTNITSKGVASLNSDVYVGGSLCFDDVCINKAGLRYLQSK